MCCIVSVFTEGKNMKELTEAERLLKELSEALDNAFISSWQSTHAWACQLEAAQEYFAKKELSSNIYKQTWNEVKIT